MKKLAALVLLTILISIVVFYGTTGLIQYRNQTNQSIAQLQDENQKVKKQLRATEEKLASLGEDTGGKFMQLQDWVQEVQKIQQKDADFSALIENLRFSLSSLEKKLEFEKKQRKHSIEQLQSADEKLQLSIANNVKELRLALEGRAKVEDLEKISRGLESNAKDLHDLRAYLELVRDNLLIRLDESSRNLSEEYSAKLKELANNSDKEIQLLSSRISELEKLKSTIELFIEEIRILEDKEVREALSTPKRIFEVHPVLLLASDDEEPSKKTKQEMIRSLAVTRAWYEDKTKETFRFNPLTILRSIHTTEWFQMCPVSSLTIRNPARMMWECMNYDLRSHISNHQDLPQLWSDSVYLVFMPSFNLDFILGQAMHYNNSGLAMVGEKVIEELSENNVDRLAGMETIGHELGHAFGLYHTDDPNMLMYPYSKIIFPKVDLAPAEVEVLIANPFFE